MDSPNEEETKLEQKIKEISPNNKNRKLRKLIDVYNENTCAICLGNK